MNAFRNSSEWNSRIGYATLAFYIFSSRACARTHYTKFNLVQFDLLDHKIVQFHLFFIEPFAMMANPLSTLDIVMLVFGCLFICLKSDTGEMKTNSEFMRHFSLCTVESYSIGVATEKISFSKDWLMIATFSFTISALANESFMEK